MTDTFFYKCVLLLTVVVTVDLGSIKRYKANLILYGGYTTDTRHIAFTNSEPSDWKNFNQLVKSAGLQDKALLCGVGSGGWITYPSPDLKNENGNGRLLIGDTCIPAKNVNSAQPLGLINKMFDGLVTFTEPFFQSEAQLLEATKGASQSGVKSLVSLEGTLGEWTVEGGGKKICVIRDTSVISAGICILPDLQTELNMPDATVTVGCDRGNDTLKVNTMDIALQTCFGTYGAYSLIDSYLKLPVVTSICQGGGDASAQLGFYKIVDAWKFRMNKDRQAEYNPANIDKNREDENTPMRLKMLTLFFEIFEKGCPVFPTEYYNLIRYIFMQHLKSIWQEAPEVMSDRNDTRFSWSAAYEFMQECYTIRKKDPESVAQSCPEAQDEPNPTGLEGQTLNLFLQGDKFDQVIEQVWIILNYVSPYCASRTTFRDNLWAEFVTFFRRQFLLPLLQQWVNPGSWQVYYQFMFNGLPLETGKRLIISCVRDILQNTEGADPVDRPSAMVSEFFSISKKWPTVTTEPTPSEQGARKKRKAPSRQRGNTTKPPTSHQVLTNRKQDQHGHIEHNSNSHTNRLG